MNKIYFTLLLLFVALGVFAQKTTITEFKLKNGYTVRGNIIDSIPNKSYTIRTLKGVEQIYSIEEIDIISKVIVGKDKIDYIPKWKFSTNIDFGLTKERLLVDDYVFSVFSNSINRSLIGASLNFNVINNTEISFMYSRISTEEHVREWDNILQTYTKDFKSNFNTNLLSVSINKYFTNYKMKPFLGMELAHSQSDLYMSTLFLPNIGVIYFLNKKIGVSLKYKMIFDLEYPEYSEWGEFKDSFKNGFYIFSLKYKISK